MNPIDLTGKTFGRLTVIERHYKNSKAGKARFKCSCACGNTIVAVGSSLTRGHTTSCSCRRDEGNRTNKLKPPGHAAFAVKYLSCKKSAQYRNLDFDLTKDQHAELIQKNCYYCNRPPADYNPYTAESIKNKRYPLLPETVERAWVKIHEVDRYNNSKGYTIDNCVSCCAVCNEMKSDRPAQDLIDHAHRIVEVDNKRKRHAA